ncbi:MAG: peptidase M14, partial [Flavobacteriaceae bacterium]|nr:peptidase M14 [Flavobacteriaceae bacterium]
MKKSLYIPFSFLLVSYFGLLASNAQEKFFRAIGTPEHPKVAVSWNRYNTYDGVVEIMRNISKVYPDLARMQSIGKSVEGRDIMLLAISDFKTGNPDKKPAMYI